MDARAAARRISQLREEIARHDHLYHIEDKPVISDAEYDALFAELIALENEHPELARPDSPTRRVGARLPATAKTVTHAVRMLSLDNTYSPDELKEWFERVYKILGRREVEFTVEFKIDGVSASLIYEGGSLALGATRGDGETGEDVTHNIRTIRSAPLRLRGDVPSMVELRGEVYMDRADFEKLNARRLQDGEEPFVNPRNAASGALKLLDPGLAAQRHLKLFVHSYGRINGGGDPSTHAQFLECARGWGFAIDPHVRVCRSEAQVLAACVEFEALRPRLPYDVDGVVVKVNRFDDQRLLGETMKSPRWAVAFKFAAHQATTLVREIVVQVGRTGVLTPVAELEPVFCGGVTISRATLHNFDEIERLGVRAGDRVLLERAGDVIPKIVKVVEKGKRRPALPRLPSDCPSCNEDYIVPDEGGVARRCVNPACPRQLERRLIHFASRDAMDIEGLGASAIRQLLDKKLVTSVADLYTLRRDDLLGLELFKDRKADNLLAAIARSKQQPLSRLIFALGIANIGQKASQLLARRFRDMDVLAAAGEDELRQVDEMGEVSAAAVVRYFSKDVTRTLIDQLRTAGVTMREPEGRPLGKLAGKTFVFTGELSRWTRSEAGARVKALGAEVGAAVTATTDFLVAGEAAGSKLDKARKLGVMVISEQEFEEMVA